MRVTIIGASRFGVATVKHLIEEGHEPILVDSDRSRLDDLADTLDCGMIHGDGTLPSVLRDAYGDGADAMVALTNVDDVNILSAVVARSVGFERVVPQIVRPELLSIVDELALDDTITPHESVARSIVDALSQHSRVEPETLLKNQLRLVCRKAPKGFVDKTVGSLSLPEGSLPIVRVRDEDEVLVDEDTVIQAGDQLLLIASAEQADQIDRCFDRQSDSAQ